MSPTTIANTFQTLKTHSIILLAPMMALLVCGITFATPINLDNLDWSVQILIDESVDPFGLGGSNLQAFEPRDNRGLAMSPNGQFLYAGYNNGPEIRRIDLTKTGNLDPFDKQLTGFRGKAIATDDVGRVYFAEGGTSDFINVYSADLSTPLGTISIGLASKSEGLALTRESGNLVLYTSDRTTGALEKRILTESGASITGAALDGSFGTSGTLVLSAGQDLRGVEVDGTGRVWAAGFSNDTLYRVSADGSTVDSVSVSNPFDIGFDNGTVLVTRYTDRLISRLDADTLTSAGADLAPTWAAMGLDPIGQSGSGALAGIVVTSGQGFYIANEGGQTLPFTETEGPFIGQTVDDNDPILFANTIPEPTTLVLLSLGLVGLLSTKRRR